MMNLSRFAKGVKKCTDVELLKKGVMLVENSLEMTELESKLRKECLENRISILTSKEEV